MSYILIAGGTGLVGSRLGEMLREKGYETALLSRRSAAQEGVRTFSWDPSQGRMDPDALREASAVINLAGAGIAERPWTQARKRLLVESRTQSSDLLRKTLLSAPNRVETYLSASAIGYYGDTGEEWTDEGAVPGRGFLAESTQAWENSFHEVEAMAIRAAAFRIGIVLSPKGGALEKMLLPFKARLGTYFGDGRQWYSWIHIDDVCRIFIHALENPEIRGVYNATAPNPARNKALVGAIGTALGGPHILVPAPAFALRLAMGEMADVILNSNRISSKKVAASGFEFRFPELVPALQDLL